MPGIMRKLTLFTTVDALILQSPGGPDQHQSIGIYFKDGSVQLHNRVESGTLHESPHLETHGILGLLNIGPSSFLLCITRREQVAQIYGKLIYVVKDVAIIPISSQSEANHAIAHSRASLQKGKPSQEPSSASEGSANESFDEQSIGDPTDSQSPTNAGSQTAGPDETSTSVVQNVIERKGQYGRFASQWFSGKGRTLTKKREEAMSTTAVASGDISNPGPQSQTPELDSTVLSLTTTSQPLDQHSASVEGLPAQSPAHDAAAVQMLPKILRTTKLLLTSQTFYFSYDFNLTKRFGSAPITSLRSVSPESIEQQYFWNRRLSLPFFKAGFGTAIVPIMQGFVGQRSFMVKNDTDEKTPTEAFESSEGVLKAERIDPGSSPTNHGLDRPRTFLLTLISRRSVKRSGLRYLRRGIDDKGNCANSVETEQILSSPTWENPATIRSFVQFRASIPLYFSQSPYAFKPVPLLQQSPEANRKAFGQHFAELQRRYGNVKIVSLVDGQGGEKRIGEEYENVTKSLDKSDGAHELGFEWFDFHSECRGMKFENVQKLVHSLENTINSHGETVLDDQITKQRQTGVIRTNCMDCLDRTNVVQSALAQYMLQKDLEAHGLEIDFVHDSTTQWFNTLWADNGDAISQAYSGSAALKGDYTRTRKRNYRGALNDFGLTLTRYYKNIVNDHFSQAVIDVLLGNLTSRVFEDFEATMKSADPGISIEKVRQNAIDTCSKIVIQHPEEDFLSGWAMLAPARTNTLRTLPFEEAILLLTDHAIYGCKFDWDTEKVASFERIDLRSVTKIHHGTYITSTLTEGQMDEDRNIGLVIVYTPGKESVKRVNTRSLQVAADFNPEKEIEGNEDSGILSWLKNRNLGTSQCMAMKVIPPQTAADEMLDSSPLAVAGQICGEIHRAIADVTSPHINPEANLVEKADIISLADARSRTGYLEQIGHSIKKLVWT